MYAFLIFAGTWIPRLLQNDNGNGGAAAAAAASSVSSLCGLVVGYGILGAVTWGLFTKAGKPGWTGFVPIWGQLQLLDVVGRPMWWFLLFLIPCVNIVVIIMVLIDLAKSFGKDTVYGVLMIIPLVNFVLIAMLSYGDAKYVGPAAKAGATPPAM